MRALTISLRMLGIMSLLLGIVYPLAITGIAQIVFPSKANGSIISVAGRVVGSAPIGQQFGSARYFHGRPSANGYGGMQSGGSNLGPTNKKLVEQAALRAEQIRKENNLPASALIPADLVLASGSGLDPHIRLESAMLQAPRIARERGLSLMLVNRLIMQNSFKRYCNIFGDSLVPVLELNRALDRQGTGHE